LSDTDPDALDRRIAEAKAASERPMAQAQAEGRGWAIGIEFVGTILVGALLGWLIDKYVIGHGAWAMIVLLVLGFAAGTRRAMQTSQQFDSNPKD
jgi:ATP synthase protein I